MSCAANEQTLADGPGGAPPPQASPAAACSRDALWGGRLPLWQPARQRGYRFNLDSVLLAGFVRPAAHAHALELGAGCGVIGLLLLAGDKVKTLAAVERQPQLATLLARNVAALGWQDRVQVLPGDLRALVLPPADLVVFNPPYFAFAASRPSLEPGRDAGRRECFGTLADFVGRGAAVLRPHGELVAILPYARRAELHALLAQAGLGVRRQRAVQALAGSAPRHLMVAAGRDAADNPEASRTWQAPLVVHRPGASGGDSYTEEVAALIAGPAAWQGPPPGAEGRWPSAE